MCDEKLNLAKLLSSCPKGTKLWSPLFGEVTFESVEKRNVGAPIVLASPDGLSCRFSEDGTYYQGYEDAECLLFPSKNCRDWSKFELFKDGDIVVSYDVRPFILKGSTDGKFPLAYGGVNSRCEFIPSVSIGERAYGGSKSSSSSTWWRHIIPLDKLIVDKEGIIELGKATDYGTHNYYA